MIKKNNKEELIKLIQENPKLPLIFMMSNGEVVGDYGYTVMEEFRAYKSTVYKYEAWGDLVFSDDEDEVVEYYCDVLADEENYKELTQEEYEKEIKKYVEEKIEHYEAIVLYVS